MDVHATGRDLMQQRFPQVCLVLVYQRDGSVPCAAEAISGTGRELKASCTAPDDDDLVWTTHVLRTVEGRLL
jgi:hypothetical protein